MAEFSFDASQVEPQQEFQLLPAGTYTAVAVSSEMRDTKSGGQMLQYKMQIVEGEHTNRVLFARFNVRNQSAQAEQIGRAQLSAFCHAVGVMNLTDTDMLLHKPVAIRVKVREARDGYGPSNEVSGFASTGGAPAPKPAAPPASAAARPSSKPWQKAA